MPGERLLRILALFGSPAGSDGGRLCDVAADATEMSGAGIMLMTGDVPGGSLCSSNEVSALVEDLQFTLGEGPCIDAYVQDRPVLEPDLADPDSARWLAFSPPAVNAGVRAVFGFPVQVGVVRLGALNLYRDRPGELTHDQHADSLVMAGVAARAVLAMQAEASAGTVAVELEAGANLRSVVHQASGMVSVQLGVSIGQALVRMRAYAFRKNCLVDEVAKDVVARRLRFDDYDKDRGARS
ncbi:MAG: GAF and ANTAR domain-containing protein [Acidimicrobiia bacterium]